MDTNFLRLSGSAKPMNQRNLIIADSAIQDSDVLLAHIADNADILKISCAREIHRAFQRAIESGYNAIHILAHGKPGMVILGGQACTEEHFTAIARSLTEKQSNQPSLHFWSCHTGAGTKGQNFVQKLSDLFGSAVSAFSGLVGAQLLGGSWVPDVFSHQPAKVKNPFINASNYAYTLVVAPPALELIAIETETGYDVQVWIKAGAVMDSADIVLDFDSVISSLTQNASTLTGWAIAVNTNPADPNSILISGFDLSALTGGTNPVDGNSDVLLTTLSFDVDASASEFTLSINPVTQLTDSDTGPVPLGEPATLAIDTNDAPTVTE